MKNLAFLLILGVGASAANASLLIDNFKTGGYNSGYFGTGSAEAYTAAGTAIGGVRWTYLNVLQNPDASDTRLRVSTTVADGVYSVSAGPEVTVYAGLGYGLTSAGWVDPLNLNLAATPILKLDFLANDQPLRLTVRTVSTDASNTVVDEMDDRDFTIPAYSSIGTEYLNLAGMDGLADCDALRFEFLNAPAGDFSLGNIEAVPEPASLALIGLGLAAMARRRR